MIIFGTRGVTYTKDDGHFYCPSCRATLPYKYKRVRRFFTLYFIPVIPLDLLGEYIECQNCRGTFKTEVRHYNPQEEQQKEREFEAEFHRGVKRVMLEMVLADGVVEDDEVERVIQVYKQIAGDTLTEERVRRDLEEVQREGQDVTGYLSSMAGSLNDNGKELIIKAAFLIAAADGEFHEDEKKLLGELASSLNMSTAHFKRVIDSFSE